jgi:hypothetical protein
MHCLQKQRFVVLIAAKIFQENFLIDDQCHQVFPQLKQFLFNGFLTLTILWAQTFFTNLEIVSADGHVVSGNLQ